MPEALRWTWTAEEVDAFLHDPARVALIAAPDRSGVVNPIAGCRDLWGAMLDAQANHCGLDYRADQAAFERHLAGLKAGSDQLRAEFRELAQRLGLLWPASDVDAWEERLE